ncbi:hypothetical protein QFC22_002790 [Naganishia vaughanmartiniae]|uniref:Uncharacterized protein n=1 Tax=Naganishia vaughanmartiniae TaxID=1424756 RepID=A0ACC2XBW5_9TREE|nr:hypothetical protein QFC22_002790 [Naganishia vaughanmartiniae]
MSDVDKGLQQDSVSSACIPGTSQTVYLGKAVGKAVDNINIAPPLAYSQPYPPSLRSRSLLPPPPVLPTAPYYPVQTYPLQQSQQQIYHLHFHHLLQPPLASPYRDENSADLRDRNRYIHYQNSDIISPVAIDRRPFASPLEEHARDSERHLIDPPPAYYRSAFVPTQDSQRTLVDVPLQHVLPPVLKPGTESDQQQFSHDNVCRDPSSADISQEAVEQGTVTASELQRQVVTDGPFHLTISRISCAEERSAKESSQPTERENLPSLSNIQDRTTCSLPSTNIDHPTQFLSPDRLRGQAGLPKTTKIRAKGSSKMYQHLSAHATGSAMLGSSPSGYASSPLTDLPDMDWAIRPDPEHANVHESDSQRTVTGDAKGAAIGIVVLQSLQEQRDLPLSTDDDKDIHDDQGQLKEHTQQQQRHQGDPFTASSSFTYTSTDLPKSLPSKINQTHSQSSENIARASNQTIDRPLSSDSSSSNHSYASSTQEEEEQFQSEIQNLLDSVAWRPETESPQGIKTNRTSGDFSETRRQQFPQQAFGQVGVKSEYPEDSSLMSAAGTPQSHTRSQLAVEASPMRPASTTPTVQSTGAASNHSQGQQNNGHDQAHLVPVTQVGDRYVYDPSRPTFPANGAGNAQSNNGGSNPVSINQDVGRTVSYDMLGGPKSAMPAFTYQYANAEEANGNTSASNGNHARHPLSAAPALGGGVTFLQLPGGGQQFYSYNGNGSPGVVIPTNMIQPTRVYSHSGHGASPFSANQQYVAAGSPYHQGPTSVTVPGFPSTMMYHPRSAGAPEPPSAFQMVVSGSHDFFDQGNTGKARKPGLYQVKNEAMSDGMAEEDDGGENDDTVGDYEQDRLRNIKRNQEMMERLGLSGNPAGYADSRGASRSPSKTKKRKTSSMGLKGTLDHKHRFKSRVPSNMGPVRASNRIASKQHRSVSYADDDRRGGVSSSEDDYSDAMEEDEDDWDEDDYRRAPRNHRRNTRRKPSYQQTGRSRAVSGRQSRGYRPSLREMLDTHPRIREAFPLFYHILTDDLMINNESFPLIGSIPSTCTPVEKANFLKEFYHKGRRCLAQLDAFTARCDKRYDGPGDKWKPLDHDTKIAIRDIRRKGVERCENYKYTRRDILNKAVGKNNWEAIEDGMIVWDVSSENCDPANDLAGAELSSPVASVHEPTNRRHVSSRHRSGRGDNYGQGITYAESSVAQVPYTARSMQQFGVYSNDRSAGYSANPQLRTAGYGDNFGQAQMQARNGWQQGNHNGFNVPSLPYAAVSPGGQQMVYTPSEAVHLAQQQHYNAIASSSQQNGEQNQQYANFNMNGNPPVMQQQQQQQQQQQSQQNQQGNNQNGSTQNGSLSAASAHEVNEQSMGMMHGGIDMDFHMAEPSYKSEVSL